MFKLTCNKTPTYKLCRSFHMIRNMRLFIITEWFINILLSISVGIFSPVSSQITDCRNARFITGFKVTQYCNRLWLGGKSSLFLQRRRNSIAFKNRMNIKEENKLMYWFLNSTSSIPNKQLKPLKGWVFLVEHKAYGHTRIPIVKFSYCWSGWSRKYMRLCRGNLRINRRI